MVTKRRKMLEPRTTRFFCKFYNKWLLVSKKIMWVVGPLCELIRICYCGEWNSLYLGLEPKKLLGHGKVIGFGLCAEGEAQISSKVDNPWKSWKLDYPRCWGQSWVPQSTHSHGKGKVLAYPRHGAQIINVWPSEDISNHRKLLECARRKKIFTSALMRRFLPNLCHTNCT